MRAEPVLVLLCSLLVMLSGCVTGGGGAVYSKVLNERLQLPREQRPAPEFELEGVDGRQVALSRLRGRAVLISFWATWCTPCLEELPSLERLGQMFDPELVVLGVTAAREARKRIADTGSRLALTFPLLLDDRLAVRERYEVAVLPTAYLINSDGRIFGRVVGAVDWDNPSARELITNLIADSGKDGTE